MFGYFKKSIKIGSIVAVVFIGSALTSACVSSSSEVFYGERCITEKEVYKFAADLTDGNIAIDDARIYDGEASEADIVHEFSQHVTPLCLNDTESLFAPVRYYDGETEHNKLNLKRIQDDIKGACEQARQYRSYDTAPEFTAYNLMINYMAAMTYLSGGPLFQAIECVETEPPYRIGSLSTPVQIQYKDLARHGAQSGFSARQ